MTLRAAGKRVMQFGKRAFRIAPPILGRLQADRGELEDAADSFDFAFDVGPVERFDRGNLYFRQAAVYIR